MTSNTPMLPAGTTRRVLRAKHQAPPKWLDDPKKRQEVMGVYEDYIACMKIPDICAKYKISAGTVYRHIGRAREEAVKRYLGSLGDILAERVDARRAIIARALDGLAKLKSSKVQGDKKARAEAALLEVVADQESEIDFLLGFKRNGQGPPWRDDPDLNEAKGRVVAILGVEGKGLRVNITPESNTASDIHEAEYSVVEDDEDDFD